MSRQAELAGVILRPACLARLFIVGPISVVRLSAAYFWLGDSMSISDWAGWFTGCLGAIGILARSPGVLVLELDLLLRFGHFWHVVCAARQTCALGVIYRGLSKWKMKGFVLMLWPLLVDYRPMDWDLRSLDLNPRELCKECTSRLVDRNGRRLGTFQLLTLSCLRVLAGGRA